MNFGSYNYLGFAQNSGPVADQVEKTTRKYGVGVCGSRQEMGMLNSPWFTTWFTCLFSVQPTMGFDYIDLLKLYT